jgi:hypothetical protein
MDESTKVNRKERKREKEIDVSVIGEKMKIREKGIRLIMARESYCSGHGASHWCLH